MSATNRTTNKLLPQFIETDKPTWLGDFNGAMLKIDNAFTDVESQRATDAATILSLQNALAALTTRVTALEA